MRKREEQVEVRKWLRQIESKTKRKGVVPDFCFGGLYQELDFVMRGVGRVFQARHTPGLIHSK